MNVFQRVYSAASTIIRSDSLIYLFILLAASLRVHNFSSASIWNDESITIDIIHTSVKKIWELSIKDPNAPLYPLITHFWSYLFGFSLPAVRFFSVVCSTLTVAVIFKISDKHFGRLAAIISSIWFSFSNIHIYYSEEARCYALLCLLMALSLFYFLDLIKSPNQRSLILYSFFSLLALYTQFFVGFQLAVQGLLILIIHRSDKKLVIRFLIYQTFVVFVFMMWFLPTFILGEVVKIDKSWIPPLSLYNLRWFLSDLSNTENLSYLILSVYLILLPIAIFILKKRNSSYKTLLSSSLIAILPFAIICTVSYYYISVFYPRYVMFTSIPLFISFGGVFEHIPFKKAVGSVVVAFMLYIMIPETRVDAFRNTEWDKACALEPAFAKDSTLFVVSPYYSEFCYIYYNMRWAYDNEFDAIHQYYKGVKNLQNLDDSITFKQRGLNIYPRVIFYDGEPMINDKLPKYFKMHYDSVYQKNMFGITFYVFDRRKQRLN